MGWALGWVGWEAEGGLNHPLAVRKSRCVLSKAQKQPQCTCQDKTVVGNSLTPLVASVAPYTCSGPS